LQQPAFSHNEKPCLGFCGYPNLTAHIIVEMQNWLAGVIVPGKGDGIFYLGQQGGKK